MLTCSVTAQELQHQLIKASFTNVPPYPRYNINAAILSIYTYV